MIRELKNLFFILTILGFIFLVLKYYFSDVNKKKSYRAFKNNEKNIMDYSKNLTLLKNDTLNTIEYVEKNIDKNKKNYNFWKLINDGE